MVFFLQLFVLCVFVCFGICVFVGSVWVVFSLLRQNINDNIMHKTTAFENRNVRCIFSFKKRMHETITKLRQCLFADAFSNC